MPASSAISRTVVAWKPFSAKSSAARRTRLPRRSEARADAPCRPRPRLRGARPAVSLPESSPEVTEALWSGVFTPLIMPLPSNRLVKADTAGVDEAARGVRGASAAWSC
ncbi:hypothetical protein NOGI109294_01870 [Nocardiopsis gilva]